MEHEKSHLVSEAYTINTEWRNRGLFMQGRHEVVDFLPLAHEDTQVLFTCSDVVCPIR